MKRAYPKQNRIVEAKRRGRWAAASFTQTEKNYRKLQGHNDLWMLQAALGRRKKEVIQQDKIAA